VYSLVTFVEFVLYQQLVLKYSKIFLALYTVLFAFFKNTSLFVVYDGITCWNMIGQKEDRLIYPNTGQAFSIDTISQETSRLAS
jgi:hypothetical protein